MLTERASDVLAGVRKYLVYAKTLFTHRFDTEAAHRAAAGLEDLARREERQNADREKAMLALQSDAAEEVVAEERS